MAFQLAFATLSISLGNPWKDKLRAKKYNSPMSERKEPGEETDLAKLRTIEMRGTGGIIEKGGNSQP